MQTGSQVRRWTTRRSANVAAVVLVALAVAAYVRTSGPDRATTPAPPATRAGGAGLIAYELSARGGEIGWIELSDLHGHKRRALTARPRRGAEYVDWRPAFSRTAAHLAFVRLGTSAESGIHVVPVAGGESRRVHPLRPDEATDVSPLVWSPDGTTIAFKTMWDTCQVSRRSRLPLTVVDVRTGRHTTIPMLRRPEARVMAIELAWVPTADELLYLLDYFEPAEPGESCNETSARELYTVPAGGGAPRLLAPQFGQGGSASIVAAAPSPDGRHIAYIDCPTAIDAGCELVSTPRTGAARRVLSNDIASEYKTLAWPAPATLVVAQTDGLYAVSARTGRRRKIVSAHETSAASAGEFVAVAHDRKSVALFDGEEVAMVDIESGVSSRLELKTGSADATLDDVAVFLR